MMAKMKANEEYVQVRERALEEAHAPASRIAFIVLATPNTLITRLRL